MPDRQMKIATVKAIHIGHMKAIYQPEASLYRHTPTQYTQEKKRTRNKKKQSLLGRKSQCRAISDNLTVHLVVILLLTYFKNEWYF